MREAKSIMLNSSNMVYKLLVVGVIILFCGISVQPCIAIIQKKETPKKPTVIQGDYNYLADLSMDFGEYIYNNRIEYEDILTRRAGEWTVNVKINFSCPENLKIVVKYSYLAKLADYQIEETYYFFNVKKTVTIINGSNPPDINKNDTFDINARIQELWLTLEIKANLTAYEYIDGGWVKIHNDEIHEFIEDYIYFRNSRTYERTQILMRLLERFPNMEVFLRIMNLLR